MVDFIVGCMLKRKCSVNEWKYWDPVQLWRALKILGTETCSLGVLYSRSLTTSGPWYYYLQAFHSLYTPRTCHTSLSSRVPAVRCPMECLEVCHIRHGLGAFDLLCLVR